MFVEIKDLQTYKAWGFEIINKTQNLLTLKIVSCFQGPQDKYKRCISYLTC